MKMLIFDYFQPPKVGNFIWHILTDCPSLTQDPSLQKCQELPQDPGGILILLKQRRIRNAIVSHRGKVQRPGPELSSGRAGP